VTRKGVDSDDIRHVATQAVVNKQPEKYRGLGGDLLNVATWNADWKGSPLLNKAKMAIKKEAEKKIGHELRGLGIDGIPLTRDDLLKLGKQTFVNSLPNEYQGLGARELLDIDSDPNKRGQSLLNTAKEAMNKEAEKKIEKELSKLGRHTT
jgi:hypothetical protein